MKKPDKPSDRFDLFSKVREGMAMELELLLEDTLPAIANEIEATAQTGMLTIQEQRQLYSAAAMLRVDRASRIKQARQVFNERALRCLELSVDQSNSKAALALLEEDELDVQIFGTDIAARLRERDSGLCLAFAKRVENITGRQWRSEDLQPLGPRTLGSAVGSALRSLVEATAAKREIKSIVLARLGERLTASMQTANQRLIDAGVLPDWQPELEKQPESARPSEPVPDAELMRGMPLPAVWPPLPVPPPLPSAPPAANEQPAAIDESPPRAVAITELAAEVSRKLDRSPLAEPTTAGKLRVLPTLQAVADIERDAVAFAHSIGTVPYSRESRREFFGNVRNRLEASKASSAQVATVDVVGAMFDYVVDDRRLPEPAKPLFWRLQQPAVALSLLDPGYLSNEPRSLRRLIENFGAIATAYSDEFVKGGELHRRLETVVRAVEIVSSALQTRSAVISEHVDREYGRAMRSVTVLVDRVVNERTTLEAAPVRQNRRDYRNRPSKQQEIEVGERLRALLEERINKHQVPESAREFILNVWLRHLRTAVLRDGEDSTEFKLALEVVDDLLWSLDSGKGKQSRRALAKRIPPLIRLLTSGLKEIGAREDEHRGFFDELFLVHLRKMRRDGPGTDGDSEFSELSPLTSLPTLKEAIVDGEPQVRPATNPAGNPPAGPAVNFPGSATVNTPVQTRVNTPVNTPINQSGKPATVAKAASTGGAFASQVAPSQQNNPAVPTFVPDKAAAEPQGEGTQGVGPDERTPAPRNPVTKPRLSRAGNGRTRTAPDASAAVLNPPSIRPDSRPATAPLPGKAAPAPGATSATAPAPATAPASAPAPSSAPAPASAPAPSSAPAPDPVSAASNVAEDRGPEQKLLDVLHNLDLSDVPVRRERRDLPTDRLLETVDRGHWLALQGNDGGTSIAKVAWVNSRRTVVLLVRHPDRRALSLRMDELRQRAEEGRAYLLLR